MTWNALAGWSRASMLRSLPHFIPLFGRDLMAAMQACAAAVLPRAVLERLMLLYASRLARAAQ